MFLIFLTQIFKCIFSVAIVTKQEIFLVENDESMKYFAFNS